jgi:hypothetical protein
MSTNHDDVYEERHCRDCQKPFTITMGEKQYLEERFDEFGNRLSLPKRCKDCRMKRRFANAS